MRGPRARERALGDDPGPRPRVEQVPWLPQPGGDPPEQNPRFPVPGDVTETGPDRMPSSWTRQPQPAGWRVPVRAGPLGPPDGLYRDRMAIASISTWSLGIASAVTPTAVEAGYGLTRNSR